MSGLSRGNFVTYIGLPKKYINWPTIDFPVGVVIRTELDEIDEGKIDIWFGQWLNGEPLIWKVLEKDCEFQHTPAGI